MNQRTSSETASSGTALSLALTDRSSLRQHRPWPVLDDSRFGLLFVVCCFRTGRHQRRRRRRDGRLGGARPALRGDLPRRTSRPTEGGGGDVHLTAHVGHGERVVRGELEVAQLAVVVVGELR